MIELNRLGATRAFTRRVFLVFALTVCTVSSVSAQGVATINIDNFTFEPAELTVTVGTTVTWQNRDDIPHSVVEKNKVFRSKALDTDESFSFTFRQAGIYDYFCGLHPHMVGKIIVKP